MSLTLSLLLAGLALTPAVASETDDRIEASFKATYVNRTYLKDDSVTPDAKDGVVTLTGTVADEAHKTLAGETAASLPGVTKVDNQLATKAEVATTGSDRWLAQKVQLALLFHRNVSASATTVAVKDGVVTLTGESANAAQRDLTSEYAKDIDGVKSVTNQMTVATAPAVAARTVGEKLDDASITAQVKAALLTHRSTSALKTTIETRDGEVTMSGIAANEAEKALVGKLVADIHGVTGIKNRMTVAAAAK